MEWVLIIAMFTPGNDMVDKQTQFMKSRRACEQARTEINLSAPDPLGMYRRGLCVTRAHWEGKKQMPGIAYD